MDLLATWRLLHPHVVPVCRESAVVYRCVRSRQNLQIDTNPRVSEEGKPLANARVLTWAEQKLSSIRFTANSPSMMTCCSASTVLRWVPSNNAATLLAMTLADARFSQV